MPTVTLLVSAMALVAVDQATKALVLATLHEQQAASFGRLTIRRVVNRGAARGRSSRRGVLLALWTIELALLIVIVELVPAFHQAHTQIALGAALGGASGNLLDRLHRNGVIDFIDVGFWPVFNVADIAIVLGTVTAASALV